jgi:hypothetical protein
LAEDSILSHLVERRELSMQLGQPEVWRDLEPVLAASLSLSEVTVEPHLATLYAKMGVGSRGEATRKALSEDWFTARDVTRQGVARDRPE